MIFFLGVWFPRSAESPHFECLIICCFPRISSRAASHCLKTTRTLLPLVPMSSVRASLYSCCTWFRYLNLIESFKRQSCDSNMAFVRAIENLNPTPHANQGSYARIELPSDIVTQVSPLIPSAYSVAGLWYPRMRA